MRNPFRTEEAAFRFLLLALVYLVPIAIASVINRWFGLAVFLLETGALVTWWLMTREQREGPERTVSAPHSPDEWRVLVIANETVGGAELLAELKRRAEQPTARKGTTNVLVVIPALNTPLRHWVSDEDAAREAARERLEASLEAIRGAGMTARGEVGDSDPVQAMDDAIRTFGPDEIIISTHPEGRSNWLERGVVEAARQRFDCPVTHVVVVLDAAEAAPAELTREA